MTRKKLKDIFGRTIGFLEDDGKTERAYNEKRQYTGRHDKSFDRTYDHQGRTVGTGNLATNTITGKKSRRLGFSTADCRGVPEDAMPRIPMDGVWWIDSATRSLLDFGCNVGELLADAAGSFPALSLSGVDINPVAVEQARKTLPSADIRVIEGPRLPFADNSFDAVTCIEVIEHVPAASRGAALAEMRRVLRPGGRLILRCPHAGAFAALDPDNLRFRVPRLYRRFVIHGRRDSVYAHGVGWHQHFRREELLELAGSGFVNEATRYGGLVVFPLGGWLAWPFYRAGRYDHPALRAIHRMMRWDIAHDYGRASYCIMLILRKTLAVAPSASS